MTKHLMCFIRSYPAFRIWSNYIGIILIFDIENCRNLSFVNIDFSESAGEKIFKNIKKCSKLTTLELIDFVTSDKTCKVIGNFIGNQTQLVKLIITSKMKENQYIFKHIHTTCDNLQEITLS